MLLQTCLGAGVTANKCNRNKALSSSKNMSNPGASNVCVEIFKRAEQLLKVCDSCWALLYLQLFLKRILPLQEI